jgi:hypothetical protein
MRALLLTLVALVLGAGTASAVPAGWVVTPGGPYTGSGGPVDSPISCGGSRITGHLAPVGDLLGTIDDLTYQDCGSGTGFTITVSVHTPWSLRGLGHASGVTDIVIEDIAADLTAPACAVTVNGQAAARFDNVTSTLTVLNQGIVVTFVDPANDCFGLIAPGEHISLLSGSYAISPAQVIEYR